MPLTQVFISLMLLRLAHLNVLIEVPRLRHPTKTPPIQVKGKGRNHVNLPASIGVKIRTQSTSSIFLFRMFGVNYRIKAGS